MAQYDLDLATSIRFREHTVGFVLDPVQWSSLVLPCVLNWNIVPFSRESLATIPDNQVGVYTFIVSPGIANHGNCGYLMYIGQTTRQSFRRRFQQYLQYQRTKKGRPLVVKMLNLWPNHLWFCYASIGTIEFIRETEESLQRAFLPPVVDQFPADVRAPIALWGR